MRCRRRRRGGCRIGHSINAKAPLAQLGERALEPLLGMGQIERLVRGVDVAGQRNAVFLQDTDAVAEVRLRPGSPDLVADVRPGVPVFACLEVAGGEHDHGVRAGEVGVDLLLRRPGALWSRFIRDDETPKSVLSQQYFERPPECLLLPFGAADKHATLPFIAAVTTGRSWRRRTRHHGAARITSEEIEQDCEVGVGILEEEAG